MTTGTDINDFMARFHALERDLTLFDDAAEGELWWDSVRFEVCYFLYDCLSGLSYSSVYRPVPRTRPFGRVRRLLERSALLVDARWRHRDLLMLRAARSTSDGVRHDVVLDPVAALFASSHPRIIDTVPRRRHLPDCPPDARGTVPINLNGLLGRLLAAFAIDPHHLAPLEARVRRLRAEYACAVAGYHRLFDRARPRAILMVQNGLEKALYHVANMRGVPTAELQHGLIGFGHPAYSYARDIDYARQTGLPAMFLIFSDFWSRGCHYPAARHAVIGTDHFATGIGPVRDGLGAIMVVAADIYHDELLALTRGLARRLPDRRIIYKLHPNQGRDEPAIRAALSDLANVVVGSATIPATRAMDEVSHLVAIQSTVVYEALQNGRRIVLVPRHDYHLHADIFDLPAVFVADGEEAMVAALGMAAGGEPGPVFFERFDPDYARALLAPVLLGQP